MDKSKVNRPPPQEFEGIDLSILPKYLCFKAALKKEKMIWQTFSLVLSILFVSVFAIDRFELSSLYQKYREKEYIVLPDFIPVSPHSISSKYVHHAVNDFIQKLGSISPKTIEEQYQMLSENMSLDFRRRFEVQMVDWIESVKRENIIEAIHCPKKEIISHGDGTYDVTALCTRDSFVNHEHIGKQDEVIEMTIAAIPPKKAKRWVLEIKRLKRSSKKSFQVKKSLSKGR